MQISEYMEVTSQMTEALFAVLGERLRLRMACCLLLAPEGLAVAEVTDALEIPQPSASRNLQMLKAAGLLEERRDGRWVYYALRHVKHPVFESIRRCVENVCCCDDIQQDVQRLRARLKLRRGGKCVIGFRAKKPKQAR